MMLKLLIYRGLWQIVKFRDWLLLHTTKLVQWCAPVALFGTVLMFRLHDMGAIWLPDFVALNQAQSHFVMWVLVLQGLAHLYLLLRRSGSLKLDVWHSQLLVLSGFSLLAVGGGFIVHYPPFSLLMVFFPLLGFLISWAGFSINKRALFLLKIKQKGKNAC